MNSLNIQISQEIAATDFRDEVVFVFQLFLQFIAEAK